MGVNAKEIRFASTSRFHATLHDIINSVYDVRLKIVSTCMDLISPIVSIRASSNLAHKSKERVSRVSRPN